MMDKGEKALALHEDEERKLNCAQSVLCALEEETGLDYQIARRIASGLGGGVRCGEICGALTGAVMAAGLALGDGNGEKDGAVAPVAAAMAEAFRAEYGCLRCDELKEKYGGKEHCTEFISYCGRLAAALIEAEKTKEKK